MVRKIFFMALLVFSAGIARGWAGDCAQFARDFQDGKTQTSKRYQFESKDLYLPSHYCPASPLRFMPNEGSRAEFYLVEQCRATDYKVLKTTLQCIQEPQALKVRSTCDLDGRLLSPCLKKDLAAVLGQTVMR